MVLNFFFNLLIISSVICSHPVHVSVTNVEYKAEQESLDISFKVFKKDMRLLFIHLNQLEIDFNDLESIHSNLGRINNYFCNNFDMEYKQDFEMKFIESKIEDEWIWFYYKAPMKKLENEITIKNKILLDLYYDQKNMVIFSYQNKEKGILFNLKNTSETINIDEI